MTGNSLITSIFRKEILAMSAYKVADASGLIKLDAMENPYNWPDGLIQSWLETLRTCELNRYPDPEAKQLTQTIREQNNIPSAYDVLLGNLKLRQANGSLREEDINAINALLDR